MLTRQQRLRDDGYEIEQIAGRGPEIEPERLAGSVEGFVGFARVPLGVAGPVRITGAAAAGDFFVPLATSEGTLIASFQHAFNAINRSGGARALCSREQVGRAPCFEFESLTQAGEFARWLPTRLAAVQETTAGASSATPSTSFWNSPLETRRDRTWSRRLLRLSAGACWPKRR
jgi:hydroxymethylglutaryl-CoA reductase (NADPH)